MVEFQPMFLLFPYRAGAAALLIGLMALTSAPAAAQTDLPLTPLPGMVPPGGEPAKPKYTDDEETMGGLPPGPGRETVFYFCKACHSLRIVYQQGLSRERWADLLIWMVEKQGMPPLEGEELKNVLDYLAEHFGT
jgi:hypothetical protein